jgi:hypothetical protein
MEESTAIQGQKRKRYQGKHEQQSMVAKKKKKQENVHMNVILRGTCITTAAVENKDLHNLGVCL